MTIRGEFNNGGEHYTKEAVTLRFFDARNDLEEEKKQLIIGRAEKLASFCTTPPYLTGISNSLAKVRKDLSDKTGTPPSEDQLKAKIFALALRSVLFMEEQEVANQAEVLCKATIQAKRRNVEKVAPYYRLLGESDMRARIVKGASKYPIKHLVCLQTGDSGGSNETFNVYDIREGIPLRYRRFMRAHDDYSLKNWENEMLLHTFLQRQGVPHLVKLHDIIALNDQDPLVTKRERGVLLEECSGSLSSRINRGPFENDSERWSIMEQLCEAFVHIHDLGYIHGDMKLDNILYTITNKGTAVKLADFENAKEEAAVKAFMPGGTPTYLPVEGFGMYPQVPAVSRVNALS